MTCKIELTEAEVNLLYELSNRVYKTLEAETTGATKVAPSFETALSTLLAATEKAMQ